ncbi:hypothetical protein AMTRI_Chr11g156400 [Amborella trichopoda]|uniref:ACB domain-containing protein n=1 Tax=Amborella trichopoda TaxID=13333 RepID=W1PNN0_AMBTC|nr:hypothetical protein AMTR_s00017p00249180 [Amborella trichopoda]
MAAGGHESRSRSIEVTDIEEEWQKAIHFVAKGPSASLQFLSKKPKSLLFAYKAQVLQGPYPSLQLNESTYDDPDLSGKEAAWKTLGDMPKQQAKREFVALLTMLVPNWKQWCNENGSSLVQSGEGEATNILSNFLANGALSLRGKL